MLNSNNNPWKGLESYDVTDSHVFFGRDKDIEKLLKVLGNSISTVIYGESGAGKTSLIRAGLFPRLYKENSLPIWIRLDHESGEDYISQIERVILNEIEVNGCEIEYSHSLDLSKLKPKDRLWMLLYTSVIWDQSNKRVFPIIFFDQFEELFTVAKTSKSASIFFSDIAEISQQVPNESLMEYLERNDAPLIPEVNSQIRFVYSLREDFLGSLEKSTASYAYLFSNKVGIRKLNGQQALDIIVKPVCEFVDMNLACKILEVLSDVNTLPSNLEDIEVEPTLLSLYCSKFYEKAKEQNLTKLTLSLINSEGKDTIYKYYATCMERLPDDTVAYIERELLTKNGFRKQLLADDIDSFYLSNEYIQSLLDFRILKSGFRQGSQYYEFTHDVLCSVAKRHRDETHSSLAVQTKFIKLLLWSYDLAVNFCVIYILLSCTEYTSRLISNPVELLLAITTILGALFVRTAKYTSFKRELWGPVVNLMLSIGLFFQLVEIAPENFERFIRFTNRQVIYLAILQFVLLLNRNQGVANILASLKDLRRPIFLVPLKLFLIAISLLLSYFSGAMSPVCFKWISQIVCFVLICIGISAFYRLDLKKSLITQIAILFLLGFLCPYGIRISHKLPFWQALMCFGISGYLFVYYFLHLYKCGFRCNGMSIYFLKLCKDKIGISSNKVFFFYPILLFWASASFSGMIGTRSLPFNCTNVSYVIPDEKAILRERYQWSINSIAERRNYRMFITRDDDGLLGLRHYNDNLVLPHDYIEIDNHITYKRAEINSDGKVTLSDYLVRVKVDTNAISYTTIFLSDYLYLNNSFSKRMIDELDTYYHSSSSARRRLARYLMTIKHSHDRDEIKIINKINKFKEGDLEDELYRLKWLVLANRMKEIAVAKEASLLGYTKVNVNDFGELFRDELNVDDFGFSDEFISTMRVLNTLAENPNAYTSDEIIYKCDSAGLGLAVNENVDILDGDPSFDVFVERYTSCLGKD